jgi:hypothetical protein
MVQIGDTGLVFVSSRSPRSPIALPRQLVATRLHLAKYLRIEYVQHQPSLLKSKIFAPTLPNPTISLPLQRKNSTVSTKHLCRITETRRSQRKHGAPEALIYRSTSPRATPASNIPSITIALQRHPRA